jgi:hypothetical protein
MTLYSPEVAVEPEGPVQLLINRKVDTPTICVEPGKYTIAFGGMIQSHPKLATGTVEFEVQEPAKPVAKEAEDKKPPHVVEKTEKVAGVDTFRNLRFEVVGEPTEDSLLGASKLFMSRMPSGHDDLRFRDFFDPRYLKKHGLTDRDIAFECSDHQGIHNIKVADDLRTVLCIVDPKGGKKASELIILRWVVYEGRLYLSPENAPDPKTGIFKPWILRTKLPSPSDVSRP